MLEFLVSCTCTSKTEFVQNNDFINFSLFQMFGPQHPFNLLQSTLNSLLRLNYQMALGPWNCWLLCLEFQCFFQDGFLHLRQNHEYYNLKNDFIYPFFLCDGVHIYMDMHIHTYCCLAPSLVHARRGLGGALQDFLALAS